MNDDDDDDDDNDDDDDDDDSDDDDDDGDESCTPRASEFRTAMLCSFRQLSRIHRIRVWSWAHLPRARPARHGSQQRTAAMSRIPWSVEQLPTARPAGHGSHQTTPTMRRTASHGRRRL